MHSLDTFQSLLSSFQLRLQALVAMSSQPRYSVRLFRKFLHSPAHRVHGHRALGAAQVSGDATDVPYRQERVSKVSCFSRCLKSPLEEDGLRRSSHLLRLGHLSAAGWGTDFRFAFHSGRCHSQDDGGLESGVLDQKMDQTIAKKEYKIIKEYKSIKAEVVGDGSVGLIMLDRPKALNALSEGLMIDVVDACEEFDSHAEVGAIVISGIGKAFAAGADIKEMKNMTFIEAYNSRIFSHWQSLTTISKPIIGAINGYALGGGCELALLCDILLAGEKAMFGQPEVTLGVIPGIGGTQRLIREVGKSRAMEMILTGKAFMDAEEAARRGLVSRVVPGDNNALLAEAVAVAKSISELSGPSVAMAKEAVKAAYEVGLQEGIKIEHSLFCAAFSLSDQKEGMAAFVEKRKPKFQHR